MLHYTTSKRKREKHLPSDLVEFLNIIPKTQFMKEKVGKLNTVKILTFCSAKRTIKRRKRQTTDWGNVFERASWAA